MVIEVKEYFFNIKRDEEIFDKLMCRGEIKLFDNYTIPGTKQIKMKKYYK